MPFAIIKIHMEDLLLRELSKLIKKLKSARKKGKTKTAEKLLKEIDLLSHRLDWY